MDFATLSGVTLAYRQDGPEDGVPLVLANSLGTDARIWDRVIAKLSPRYRVLSYDKRGHGLSDAPQGPYSLDDHLADLLSLTQHLGIPRFALCGVSVGGMIAQLFAARHPEQLSAVVLCNTAARIGDAAFWNSRIETVVKNGVASISEAVLVRWFSPDFRTSRPAEYAGYRNMLERASVDGYIATCAAIRDADLGGEVRRIATPTLVIAGEHDKSTPPDLVRETASLIPNSRFVMIQGAGHIPSIEQPDQLATLIDAHIQEALHG